MMIIYRLFFPLCFLLFIQSASDILWTNNGYVFDLEFQQFLEQAQRTSQYYLKSTTDASSCASSCTSPIPKDSVFLALSARVSKTGFGLQQVYSSPAAGFVALFTQRIFIYTTYIRNNRFLFIPRHTWSKKLYLPFEMTKTNHKPLRMNFASLFWCACAPVFYPYWEWLRLQNVNFDLFRGFFSLICTWNVWWYFAVNVWWYFALNVWWYFAVVFVTFYRAHFIFCCFSGLKLQSALSWSKKKYSLFRWISLFLPSPRLTNSFLSIFCFLPNQFRNCTLHFNSHRRT